MKEPRTYIVNGILLRCQHCGFEEFQHRQAQLHTAFQTFFDIEWLSPSADIYRCARCGFLHWFLPSKPQYPIVADAIQCRNCGEEVPRTTYICPHCGWKYIPPPE